MTGFGRCPADRPFASLYRDIVRPEQIVYADYFSDKAGNIAADMPESTITMKFKEQDGKTKFTTMAPYTSLADLEKVVEMGMEAGIEETLDRLVEHLEPIQKEQT